jgi:hypothetical protein
MTTANDITLLVDDLAGQWTDAAMRILKGAGMPRISVDMEVEAWQTLKKVLRTEIRWERLFRFSSLVSWSGFTEQALRKSAILVAQKFEP